MKPLLQLQLYCIITSFVVLISGQQYTPDWNSLDSRPLPEWYDNGKVGIFIHWGVYSVPSYINEWFWWSWKSDGSEGHDRYVRENFKPGFTYPEFAPMFTAEFFDPDQWAQIIENSGAKYVVLTSKHHEGYALWPSSHGFNWNSVDIGPHRDLVGDLATAVRKTSVRFGLYYSLLEWFHPMYESDKSSNWASRRFPQEKSIPTLKELVELYKPEVIWSDGEWEAPDKYWGSEEFLAWLYNESPVNSTVVTNDRWGSETRGLHGGFYNFDDRYNPGVLIPHKWENAFTIDKRAWTYRREARLSDFMTPEELIQQIVVTVACGGNVLVNVGPTKEGTIPIILEERLSQMGEWLGMNGEAIYETIPWTYQNDTLTPGVWYTTNKEKDKVYAMILNWPENNEISLGAMSGSGIGTNTTVTMLPYDFELNWEFNGRGDVVVQFPGMERVSRAKWAWTIVFDFQNQIKT